MFTAALKKNSFFSYALLIITLAVFIAILCYPNSSAAFTEGLKLWLICVLPSVFPFTVLSAVISNNPAAAKLAYLFSPLSEKVFKINGNGAYAFFLSTLSGYPVGAKVVSELSNKGLLSQNETLRAAIICSTASPVFLISGIGAAAFNSLLFGVMLFVTQVVSAFCVGVILSFAATSPSRPEKTAFLGGNFSLFCSIEKSVFSIITVGAIIALIYLFTDMLYDFGLLNPFIYALRYVFGNEKISEGVVFSLFECTKGVKRISESGITFLSLPLCAAACGFGGASVIAQSLAFLKTAKIKTAAFVLGKLLSAVINFIIGLIFSVLLFA